MSRFSNINWTAFLFGALWGDDDGTKWRDGDNPFSGWVYLWGFVLIVTWASAVFADFTIPALTLTLYAPLSAASAYLALQGNRVLLKEIKELNLSPEEEQKERMMVAARQKRFVRVGVVLRLTSHYGMLGVFPVWRAALVITGSGNTAVWAQALEVVFAMMVMDAIAFVVVLFVAFVRGDKEDALYAGKIPSEVMASISTKAQPREKRRLTEQECSELQAQRKKTEKQRETALLKSRKRDEEEHVKGNIQAAFDSEDDE